MVREERERGPRGPFIIQETIGTGKTRASRALRKTSRGAQPRRERREIREERVQIHNTPRLKTGEKEEPGTTRERASGANGVTGPPFIC